MDWLDSALENREMQVLETTARALSVACKREETCVQRGAGWNHGETCYCLAGNQFELLEQLPTGANSFCVAWLIEKPFFTPTVVRMLRRVPRLLLL